jgi:hypothetical protein
MVVFCKCPVCGESAIVKPELANGTNRVFCCENGHQFEISSEKPEKVVSQDIWDHMPKWARMLNELSKNGKIGS